MRITSGTPPKNLQASTMEVSQLSVVPSGTQIPGILQGGCKNLRLANYFVRRDPLQLISDIVNFHTLPGVKGKSTTTGFLNVVRVLTAFAVIVKPAFKSP